MNVTSILKVIEKPSQCIQSLRSLAGAGLWDTAAKKYSEAQDHLKRRKGVVSVKQHQNNVIYVINHFCIELHVDMIILGFYNI